MVTYPRVLGRVEKWREHCEKGAFFVCNAIGSSELEHFYDKKGYFPDKMGHFHDKIRTFEITREIFIIKGVNSRIKRDTFKR